jgi:hypothetical protein
VRNISALSRLTRLREQIMDALDGLLTEAAENTAGGSRSRGFSTRLTRFGIFDLQKNQAKNKISYCISKKFLLCCIARVQRSMQGGAING